MASTVGLPRFQARAVAAAAIVVSLWLGAGTRGRAGFERLPPAVAQAEAPPTRTPDFDRMQRLQAETDRTWRAASSGFMQFEKITYRSRVGDLDIPAFVLQPLKLRGPKGHAALVWVHEDIRGHLYEHHIPFIREATARGYVVVAPEYRGSIGHGEALYDAIDYGGAEVDDVVSAVEMLAARYPQVDPARIGIIGWSHGGMISLLSVFRNPTTFRAAAAMVPVTNLFHRLAWKGIERQRQAIDPHNRFGGSPSERRDVYLERSPLFQVDKLQIPLLVHVADNDEDVSMEESLQLLDALRARKPALAETKAYASPPGGHTFDRRVEPTSWLPENTAAQRDSWDRVWAFFDNHLEPFRAAEPTVSAAPPR